MIARAARAAFDEWLDDATRDLRSFPDCRREILSLVAGIELPDGKKLDIEVLSCGHWLPTMLPMPVSVAQPVALPAPDRLCGLRRTCPHCAVLRVLKARVLRNDERSLIGSTR